MSLANDTLVASPVTRTSGQPGPVAMVHAKWPPAAGAKLIVTARESPGDSVRAPPPSVTVKSAQLATTSRITGAVPALNTLNRLSLSAGRLSVPKSSESTDTVHTAPGAWRAPEPESVTGGRPLPSDSSHGELPT